MLLSTALERAYEAGTLVGARFVVVDAIDDLAHSFYQRHGFTPIPETNRLLMKMSSIKVSIEPNS